jgi:hypothetical protein
MTSNGGIEIFRKIHLALRVPRDPQLHCLAGILVLFTGSDPAGQTDATVALINAPTGSTAVLYLTS